MLDTLIKSRAAIQHYTHDFDFDTYLDKLNCKNFSFLHIHEGVAAILCATNAIDKTNYTQFFCRCC